MKSTTILAALLTISVAGCGPRIKPVQPIMDNGQILPTHAEERVARARLEGELERARLEDQRAQSTIEALTTCVGVICDAVARGEVALGMNESQVLAVTRTTPAAWQVRVDGRAAVMTSRAPAGGPRDALGEVVFVSLQDGLVRGYTYREPQGFRTVTAPEDATRAGRAAAQADALLRLGDEYALQGDLARALDRYDRADILRPNHPETILRIATTLDKSLRPIEAILRYQMFIHQMELERIQARGEAAARIAEAITRAQERIIILERHR
jgi:tetratricopeptide (TPR) repeat protein